MLYLSQHEFEIGYFKLHIHCITKKKPNKMKINKFPKTKTVYQKYILNPEEGSKRQNKRENKRVK